MRELLTQKLHRLSAHLDLYSIDVTLITFNWFLTLFIDAMPTEVHVYSPPPFPPHMYRLPHSLSYSLL